MIVIEVVRLRVRSSAIVWFGNCWITILVGNGGVRHCLPESTAGSETMVDKQFANFALARFELRSSNQLNLLATKCIELRGPDVTH
jgi:hypothetical protein